jgi:hypothetical protein
MAQAFCGACGHRLENGDEFCTACGSPTEAKMQSVRQPTQPVVHVAPLPPGMRTNSLAIAAFVISLVACTPVGLWLGYKARSQIRESGEQGAGFAMAAIIIGWIGVFFFVITVIFFLVLGSWASVQS